MLQQISHTIHWLVYGQLSGLILSCAGDMSTAMDHGYNSFFSFFSALFGRPLAATIDLRVELMTKMTNPWGAQVREIMRETERESKRPRPTCTTWACDHTHKHTLYFHTALSSVYFRGNVCGEERCHIYAAQGRHFFWVQGLLVRCWHECAWL